MTAISETEWWVLGHQAAGVDSPLIVHTTDGGQSFTTLPAPPVTFDVINGSPRSPRLEQRVLHRVLGLARVAEDGECIR